MPTGYTDQIKNDIAFDEFVWTCARGMGALIMMRDAPHGAPIPERFEPSSYSQDRISEAKVTLNSLEAMSEGQTNAAAITEFETAKEYRETSISKNNALRLKYEEMLHHVMHWVPPTSDHMGLKEFMVEQINSSIKFDCNNSYYEDQKITLLTGSEWRDAAVMKAKKDLAYHESDHKKEVERTEDRNDWLSALRRSL